MAWVWWAVWGAGLAADAEQPAKAPVGMERVEPEVVVEAPPFVLEGGTVWTGDGSRYDRGFVAVSEGRITDVGDGPAPESLPGPRIDITGQHVTPGIIDTHSHLGVYPSPGARAHSDGNEATSPNTAGVWAEHSTWPQDPGFYRAIAGGVTTLHILPGSANLIGGRGVTLRSVPGRGSRAMRFPGAPETVKMACGENPKRVYGDRGGPATRMGNLRGVRQAFADVAKDLPKDDGKKKKKKGKGTGGGKLSDNLNERTLQGVLKGEILPQVHCYRADDMIAMLQVAEEFGFHIRSFHHATEAYKIRDILAEKNVSASVWADWWGFKLEAYDAVPAGAAMVAAAGAKAVVHSDSGIGIQRLNQESAKALRAGRQLGLEVDEDDAITWITLNAAWTLGIEDETGSLTQGKRADLVVWDQEPLSVYASARLVFVDGALRYDKDRPQTWSDFEVGQALDAGENDR
ncbi:MAG: amidohydrolase family protein [Myxococcota bacterium]